MYESVRFYRQIETPCVVATPAAAAFDAATLAWVAAVVANGGTVSAGRKTLVDNLITGLKADGVWTKLDRLWLLAGENAASALTDLVAATLATAVNSPTFTVDTGYAGDGATSYINSNYNPSTQGVAFVLNSASLSLWTNTSRAVNPLPSLGAFDGLHVNDITAFATPGIAGVRVNSGTTQETFTVGGSQGFLTGNRDTSASEEVYFNGLSIGSGTHSSTAIPSLPLYICGRNDSSTLTGITDQLSAVAFGGSHTASDASNLYSRLRTYMTAVGIP